uniref:RxLR effector candidate protein n=1 Tax=Hyaloperonospora arabidopsidis (strain Emoy2) TaxID=559515 RepID=M4C2H4_HYAAE
MILLVLLWLWWKTTQLLMKLLARDCSSSVAVQEDVRAIGAGMEPRRKIVPYRVFWYPGSPTYSPKRVSFAFYELRDDGEVDTLVYESTVFNIVMDMTMETFELPRRVFLSRGMLRLTLFDRQEDIGLDVARWMQEYNLPPYYTCLSYVGATGLLERCCW